MGRKSSSSPSHNDTIKHDDNELDKVREVCGYKFLQEEATIKHIKQCHIMFIMRGLPGSGKSTLVKLIESTYKTAQSCSADMFRMKDGEYEYDAEKVSEGHEKCQAKAKELCDNKHQHIIVDNTHIQHWELRYYFNLAAKAGYSVIIVLPKTAWRFDPVQLAIKNTHNVPEEALRLKLKKFQPVLPLYFGWFVNQSTKLEMELGFHKILKQITKIGSLKEELEKFCPSAGEGIDSLLHRYAVPEGPFHITAKYNGLKPDKSEDALEYADKDAVKKSLGQLFQISIIGYILTPSTIGARIRLNSRQKQLWAQDDTEGLDSLSNNKTEVNLALSTVSNKEYTCEVSGKGKCDTFKTSFRPTHGFGSRAHMTLGCGPDSQPVQTGLDLVDIIDCESKTSNNFHYLQIEGAKVRYYGKGRCGIYLENFVKVNTIFSGFYV